MNNKINLLRAGALAFAIACLSATTARAVVVTVNSVQYDVTAITNTPTNLFPTLQTQPWFGNQSTVLDFAAAVGLQLGTPNVVAQFPLGPLFVYSGNANNYLSVAISPPAIFFVVPDSGDPDAPRTFAVASQVRGVPDSGATIAMLCFALGGLVTLRRRLA